MDTIANSNQTKSAILLDIFPDATEIGRGGGEVNGLKENTVPQNCTILLKTPSPWQDDRIFCLLAYETPEVKVILEVRVCKAMEGSGYDEFAVIHKFNPIDVNTTDYSDIIKESYAYRISEYA